MGEGKTVLGQFCSNCGAFTQGGCEGSWEGEGDIRISVSFPLYLILFEFFLVYML